MSTCTSCHKQLPFKQVASLTPTNSRIACPACHTEMQADEKQLKSMGILMGAIFAGLSFTAAYGFFKQLPWWIYVLGSLAVVLGIGLYWKYKTVKLLPLH